MGDKHRQHSWGKEGKVGQERDKPVDIYAERKRGDS
jgi:hypothetical protein